MFQPPDLGGFALNEKRWSALRQIQFSAWALFPMSWAASAKSPHLSVSVCFLESQGALPGPLSVHPVVSGTDKFSASRSVYPSAYVGKALAPEYLI